MANKIKKIKKRKNPNSIKSLPREESAAVQRLSASNLFQQALRHFNKHEFSLAEECCRNVLEAAPHNADAYHLLGIIASQHRGRNDLAVQFISRAVELNPHNATVQNNLGIAFRELKRTDEAIACFKKTLAIDPDNTDALHYLGVALHESNRLDEAVASYRKAVAINPDLVNVYRDLGNALKQIGRTDEAIATYRKTLAIKPDYAEVYRSLSTVKKFREYNDDIRSMENLYNRKDLTGDQRIQLCFALGKAFEDLKQYDKAFGFLAEGNSLKRKSYSYSIKLEHDIFARLKRTFSRSFFAAHQNTGNSDATPILILGMPRSGTTLVEQILASHPHVYGGGELEIFADIIDNLGGADGPDSQFPECLAGFSKQKFYDMGTLYIDKIRQLSGEAQYITNKMPHNFLLVGLVKLILPNARIIHCTREPMDNCFSIFKTYFGIKGTHPYAYDLAEIGQYYKLYQSIMEHWEKMAPGFMYHLKYEELVADQQNQTRSLLNFCELAWDDACLSFHRNIGTVRTASHSQVRQPLYTDSVALWKHYKNQLEPLHNALNNDLNF